MKRFVSLALAGLLAAAALVGCAGGNVEESKEPTASAAATETKGAPGPSAAPDSEPPASESYYSMTGSAQGVTATTVRVGNSVTESGTYAAVGGPFIAGMKAYFEFVNSNGGVDGRKIEYVHYDDHFDAAEGKTTLIKLVENDKVFALVGHFGTPVVAATLDDIRDYGIPAVYFATGIGALYNDRAVGEDRVLMPVQPIYTMEGRVMAAYAKGYFKAKTIGIIYTTDEAGNNLHDGAKTHALELGLEVKDISIETLSTDATAQLQQLLGADVIIAAAIQGTFPTIIKDMEKLDFIKPVITSYVNCAMPITTANAPMVQKLMNEAGIYALGWVDVKKAAETPYVDQMVKTGYTEYYNNANAMAGWIAASFFVEGLNRLVGYPLTWENYILAMESAPIENPFGGMIDYKDGQRLGTQDFNLSRMDDTVDNGWVEDVPIAAIDDILAGTIRR